MLKNNYPFIISHLKLALARKAYFFDIKLSKQTQPFVRLLKDLGIIKRFYIVDGQLFRIYPTFFNQQHKCMRITNLYKPSRPVFIKVQALRLLKKHVGLTTLVIETNKGLMTNQQAVTSNTGGRLVCIIN